MTYDEIADLAIARCAIFTRHFPSARSIMYRRIGVRLRQLQSRASRINGDYFGVYATAALAAGAADLNDVIEPTPTPSQIQRITVNAVSGVGVVAVGDEIHIVPSSDITAAIAPRMTMRDLVLEAVGGDLANATQIRVHYSKLAPVGSATSKDVQVELAEPYPELLVVDLAKHLLGLTTEMDSTKRTEAIALLTAEEQPMEADFYQHVAEYLPTEDRFARPPVGVAHSEE